MGGRTPRGLDHLREVAWQRYKLQKVVPGFPLVQDLDAGAMPVQMSASCLKPCERLPARVTGVVRSGQVGLRWYHER